MRNHRLTAGSSRIHRWSLACLLILTSAAWGCGDPITALEGITSQMTLAEIDNRLGNGQEIPYEQLPRGLADLMFGETKGKEGVTYRRWTRSSGDMTGTLHAAFKDGKMVAGPLVLKAGNLSFKVSR